MSDAPARPTPVTIPNRRIYDVEALTARLALAQAYRPPGWETTQIDLRREYEGEGEAGLMAAAANRFPATSTRMPRTAFNWAETLAVKGASIYDLPPTRNIVADDDAVPEDDDPASRDFADLIKGARLSMVMPEADRRRYLCKSVVLGVRSDTLAGMVSGKPAPTVVDLFWSHDVYVIPHPQAPSSLQAALEVFVRHAAPAGSECWLHWMHDVAFDGDGNTVTMGAWSAEMITVRRSRRGGLVGVFEKEKRELEVSVVWAPYPLPRLPYVVMTSGIAAGFPFVAGNGNLPSLFRMINTSLMSEAHTVDMTSAPILVHTTNQPQSSRVVIGPGVKVNLLKGETLESVTQTSDLAGMRASNAAHVENLALTTRQSPGAFTGSDGAESGIALKIKSLPASKQRNESKEQTRPFEEEELLPLLVEVHDHFRATSIGDTAKGYRVAFVDPPDFETPAEKQTRFAEAVALGWIDDARAATECGFYASEKDAQVEIDAHAEARQARMGAGLLKAMDGEGEGMGDGGDDQMSMDGPMAMGSRVRVKAGKEHDSMTKGATGTVAEVKGTSLGIQFDGMDKIHRWYTAAELESVGGAKPTTDAPDAPINVQSMALNGAQVASMLDVVSQVSTGVLPRDAGIAILVAAFPGVIDETEARDIIGKIPIRGPAPPPPAGG